MSRVGSNIERDIILNDTPTVDVYGRIIIAEKYSSHILAAPSSSSFDPISGASAFGEKFRRPVADVLDSSEFDDLELLLNGGIGDELYITCVSNCIQSLVVFVFLACSTYP